LKRDDDNFVDTVDRFLKIKLDDNEDEDLIIVACRNELNCFITFFGFIDEVIDTFIVECFHLLDDFSIAFIKVISSILDGGENGNFQNKNASERNK
jgi:hypothetical protein